MSSKLEIILNILFVLFYITQFSKCDAKKDLHCYTCMNIDCSDDDLECQQIRSFLRSELEAFYYFDGDLKSCPNETFEWRVMQMDLEPYPEQKAGEATCSLGLMEIKSIQRGTTRYNYANIMGCARRLLLQRTKKAFNEGIMCDSYYSLRKENPDSTDYLHLELKHCNEISRLCHHKDFCLNWRDSVVERWKKPVDPIKDYDRSEESNESVYIGVILVVSFVSFIAILLAWPKIIKIYFCIKKKSKSVGNANAITDQGVEVALQMDTPTTLPSGENIDK